MAKCKSCGAEIRWIKMRSGKSMPCNPVGIRYREGVQGDGCVLTLVTPDGDVTTGQPYEKAELIGYISHFATCPFANQHRRR